MVPLFTHRVVKGRNKKGRQEEWLIKAISMLNYHFNLDLCSLKKWFFSSYLQILHQIRDKVIHFFSPGCFVRRADNRTDIRRMSIMYVNFLSKLLLYESHYWHRKSKKKIAPTSLAYIFLFQRGYNPQNRISTEIHFISSWLPINYVERK